MRTDDPLRALAADGGRVRVPLGRLLTFAVAGTTLLVAVVYLPLHGLRTDIVTLDWSLQVIFKLAVPLAAALAAGALALDLVRPGVPPRRRLAWLAVVATVLALGVATELAVLPASEWWPRMVGRNAVRCLATVPVLSALPLAAALAVLSRGAPMSPAAAGASAGLAAGAAGALVYALVCPDDSPLFVAVWYGIAVAAVTALGALAGRRFLRW